MKDIILLNIVIGNTKLKNKLAFQVEIVSILSITRSLNGNTLYNCAGVGGFFYYQQE